MTHTDWHTNQRARAIMRDVQFYNGMVARFQTRDKWNRWLNTHEGLLESLAEPRYLSWPIEYFTSATVAQLMEQIRPSKK